MPETVRERAMNEIATRKEGRPRYQLTIGSNPAFVWFRNAKVGTRTLLALLNDAPISFEIEEGFDLPFRRKRYLDHFKFALVRNPWDRFVSAWRDKIVTPRERSFGFSPEERERSQDFEEFAKLIASQDPKRVNIHFRPQSEVIDLNAVDHIGRFENFEAEIRTVFERLGLPAPEEIPHKNRSRHEPYATYYGEKTREIVADFYEKDVRMFGYEFEGATKDG